MMNQKRKIFLNTCRFYVQERKKKSNTDLKKHHSVLRKLPSVGNNYLQIIYVNKRWKEVKQSNKISTFSIKVRPEKRHGIWPICKTQEKQSLKKEEEIQSQRAKFLCFGFRLVCFCSTLLIHKTILKQQQAELSHPCSVTSTAVMKGNQNFG